MSQFDESKIRRGDDGKFAEKPPAPEADVELPGNDYDPADISTWDEDRIEAVRERGTIAMENVRAASMDPVTGGCTPRIKEWSWSDDETGDFAFGSEDVANTPSDYWSDPNVDEMLVRQSCIEAEPAEGRSPQEVAAAAYERTGSSWESATAEEQDEWTAHAEAVVSPGETPAIYAAVRDHEADGGVIDVSDDDGVRTVRWLGDSNPDYEYLFRKPAQGQSDAPAHFRDGEPATWVAGRTVTRAVHQDGTKVEYHSNETVRREERSDGSVYHRDRDWEYHREDGPAVTDSDGQRWYRHGELDRDPADGPAELNWDGEVTYRVDGQQVDPHPDQAAAHGVVPYADADLTSYSIPYSRPGYGPASKRWKVEGSQPGGEGEFDWSGHPLRSEP